MISKYHNQITTEALGESFNSSALNYIKKANTDSDKIEAENKYSIFTPYNAAQHFNKTSKEDGLEFIEDAKEVVEEDFIEAAKSGDSDDYAQGLYDFGRLIHCVQDFYSHTNWINQTEDETVAWNEDIENANIENPENLTTTDYSVLSQFADEINPWYEGQVRDNYEEIYDEGSKKVSHYGMNKDDKGSIADKLYEEKTGTSGVEQASKDAALHTENEWAEITESLKEALSEEEYSSFLQNLSEFDLTSEDFNDTRTTLRKNFKTDMSEK